MEGRDEVRLAQPDEAEATVGDRRLRPTVAGAFVTQHGSTPNRLARLEHFSAA